jgi:predicted DNA-binding transcriptional regulator YafY
MRRTDRLFEIVQMFRSGRTLTAASIAARLEVSERTVYRDLDTLVASGVPVEGERGVGLHPARADLPAAADAGRGRGGRAALPRSTWRGAPGDPVLADAIERVRGKVDAALPPGRQARAFARALSSHARSSRLPVLGTLRAAIREGRTVSFDYESLSGARSARVVRPLQLEWWGAVWTLTGWCDLREDFRVFRVDRIEACAKAASFRPEPGRTYADCVARMVSREGGVAHP